MRGPATEDVVYLDRLVRLTTTDIRFSWYYFPFGSKTVALSEIEWIDQVPSGCWRIWGSGDFRTWFPCDWSRPSRLRIYVLHRRAKFVRIGFTVERDEEFELSLQRQGIHLRP